MRRRPACPEPSSPTSSATTATRSSRTRTSRPSASAASSPGGSCASTPTRATAARRPSSPARRACRPSSRSSRRPCATSCASRRRRWPRRSARSTPTTGRSHADGAPPRAPAELMDRLADHFLRVTDAKVTWVHPSWRDLVIDELVLDRAARRRFLARAELDGVLLALAVAGGHAGDRVLPLLVDDGDWDLLGDRVAALARDTDDHDALRLLAALDVALDAEREPAARSELHALAAVALGAVARRLERAPDPPGVAILAACLRLDDRVPEPDAGRIDASLERTWFALMPGTDPPQTDDELRAADDWLWLPGGPPPPPRGGPRPPRVPPRPPPPPAPPPPPSPAGGGDEGPPPP